ncbi:MAG: tetratricopeptide repeat protein, partial [Kiritimatiellae bacterium]|nr:tetratricopeptide repeat protein [Kiritimatiellia bacterium]
MAGNWKSLIFKCSVALLALLAPGAGAADDIAAGDRQAFADGLMARGLHALALREYAALAESTPAGAGLDTVLSRLAECQRLTGDNAAADATCARFEREFPESPRRFNNALTHALALSALGDPLRSSRLFDILSAEPDAPRELHLSAIYFSGENYFNAGETDAARQRFRMLVAQTDDGQAPESVRELRGFAQLYLADIEAAGGTPSGRDAALASYARIADAPETPRIGAEALFRGARLAAEAGKF